MSQVLLLGATGMTGSHILSTLMQMPVNKFASVTTISRRAPNQTTKNSTEPPKLITVVEKDTSKWESLIPSASSEPGTNSKPDIRPILISSLATTRAAAGGFDKQYLLEHDLNVAMARRAKETGTTTYVLISAANANLSSWFPYSRMKAEIERDVLALGFDTTIILRPGLIGGRREESRPAEAVIQWIADGLGFISNGALKDFWTQDADVIARAAVRTAWQASIGNQKGKIILGGKDIMQLGRSPLTVQE